MKIFCFTISLCFFLSSYNVVSQTIERPYIWVKQGDRSQILNKIKTQTWANSFYKEYKNRLDRELEVYKESPINFLKKIPLNWSQQKNGGIPPLKIFEDFKNDSAADRGHLNKYLQTGIDCGVLFYLTENEFYAQCALDILYTYLEGILELEPSKSSGNGGWIYPNDHLREARVVGAQLPIIYDFIAPYILKNKKAFNIGTKTYADFSINNAQKVFLTYAKLAVEHGHTGSNWSVLESYSLVQNALALDNLDLQKHYLNYYLIEGTATQDALPNVSENYKNEGDVYPETSQYSNGVATYTTRLLYMLNKYDSSLKLGKKYYKIPFSLDRWNALRYPNNEIIRFGDGHREYATSFASYDMAYALGLQDSVPKLINKFGPLITQAIENGDYNRGYVGRRSGSVSVYTKPLDLLWLNETPEYAFKSKELPRTDKFTHAGVFLQRNLGISNNPKYGLMCFVGGAHMVHGHASGMDMELYGLGEVLGVDHGRGQYKTDLHENYSRLFAAHNTVVVNGASQGAGGWVSLGINSTQLITMEPKPTEKALSPNYSFTTTSFLDNKGDKAEATQERTLALVRTSPTTGYYVDVFRSKSALPNEYHDYLYHNIGDQLSFFNSDLNLKKDDGRYQGTANSNYVYNKKFRNPGWHFFKNVESSKNYKKDVKATFEIKQLEGKNRYMNVFILGNENREYTKAMAPKTFEAPKPYDELNTPTLVIRQKGEAWNNPFAVIYEPSLDKNSKNGIQKVTKLEVDSIFKGFKVISKIDKVQITQYVIIQEPNSIYENKEIDVHFKGAYAIITFNEKDKLQNIYIGAGVALHFQDINIQSKNLKPIAGYIEFNKGKVEVNITKNAELNGLRAK